MPSRHLKSSFTLTRRVKLRMLSTQASLYRPICTSSVDGAPTKSDAYLDSTTLTQSRLTNLTQPLPSTLDACFHVSMAIETVDEVIHSSHIRSLCENEWDLQTQSWNHLTNNGAVNDSWNSPKQMQAFIDLVSSPLNAKTSSTKLKRRAEYEEKARGSFKKHKTLSTQPNIFNCGQCGKFCTGATERENGSCLHHEGVLEVDYRSETWRYWDEYVHGRIDTTKRRCDYPEGFYWTCCGSLGTSPGCIISLHRNIGNCHQAKLRAAGLRY